MPEPKQTSRGGAPPIWLTVGELAARSGVATSALRFYEDRRLIAAMRTPSGHRRYPRSMIRRVAFILFAQRIGFSLAEIRVELEKLPSSRAPDREEWAALSSTWAERVELRMAELQRLRRGLTDCIGCGCLSLDRCAILNPRDRAAASGAGPRFWLEDRQ
jgi:MerR family transcriptional regulator, redox-sensitive transcriptional activator SoxR